MRASRKGIRLNDVQYFRQPLPHVRKKMTAMFLMPRVSNLHLNDLYAAENTSLDNERNANGKTKIRYVLDINQESVEMGLVDGSSDCCALKEPTPRDYKEISTETDVKSSKEVERAMETDQNSVLTEVNLDENLDSDKSRNVDNEANVIVDEKTRTNTSNTRKVQKTRRNDSTKYNYERPCRKEKKEESGWWRNSWIKQTIFHFFAQIFDKAAAPFARDRTKIFVPGDESDDDEINRNNKDDQGRKVTIEKTRLKKVVNPRTAFHDYGDEESVGNVDYDSNEEVSSMLVRQIRRTRDKNLRVTLLQQELETRFRTDDARPENVLNEKFVSRQLSSPLC